MRVALISDLHANLEALRAVLADAERVGVDQVICLGDVATLGPCPREVLQVLRDRAIPCILGNHDEFLLDAALIRRYTEAPVVVDSVDWCRDRLRTEDLEWIRDHFKAEARVDLGGGATLQLFHGTPRSHMEDLLATTPTELVDEMLAGRSGTVLAGGHTHLPMVRAHRGALLVNPGSAGLPFLEPVVAGPPVVLPWADYATVEADPRTGRPTVSLRRVEVDKARLLAQAISVPHPLADDLAVSYR